ncbi:MAG: hypothetical protein ACW98D_13765 [Promethearchaeota archaeon]|jgi:hypothetical protein
MDIKVNSLQTTLEKLYELLSTETKVYYCRFGDGDFNIMSGIGRCIEHAASPELQKELIESFMIDDPNYIKGVMVNEPTFNGVELQQVNPTNNLRTINFIGSLYDNRKELVLDSHVLLTWMAICKQEIMMDFLDRFIRPKKKLFIGSVDKNEIEKLVGKIDYYVEIPCAKVEEQKVFPGAYYFIDEWWPKVLECIDDVELVLPTAGMAGRVITKRLWNLNKNIHSIELGSMVDAVVGKMSRSIWKRTGDKIYNLLREV